MPQLNDGFWAMMSILIFWSADEFRRVAMTTDLFLPATCLGEVENLIEHRATVEGPKSLVPQNLIRLSIGIEDASDLISDLKSALEDL